MLGGYVGGRWYRWYRWYRWHDTVARSYNNRETKTIESYDMTDMTYVKS